MCSNRMIIVAYSPREELVMIIYTNSSPLQLNLKGRCTTEKGPRLLWYKFSLASRSYESILTFLIGLDCFRWPGGCLPSHDNIYSTQWCLVRDMKYGILRLHWRNFRLMDDHYKLSPDDCSGLWSICPYVKSSRLGSFCFFESVETSQGRAL